MNETELFAPYEGELDGEELAPKDAGYWKTACKIFLKNKMGVFSAIVLIVMIIFCVAGENLRPYRVQDQNTAIKNEAPSKEHWFGTDQPGRDIFVRVCHGGQVSIEIGLFASLIVSLIGVIYGSISGYLGGRADMVMMRLVEAPAKGVGRVKSAAEVQILSSAPSKARENIAFSLAFSFISSCFAKKSSILAFQKMPLPLSLPQLDFLPLKTAERSSTGWLTGGAFFYAFFSFS